MISNSSAPSNTGVETLNPRTCEARPRWISRTCPIFIREGTPSGFNTISSGRPFGRNGISSTGSTREITPLLPWRPAILSPTWIFLFWAMYTLTDLLTPGESSSPFSLVKILVSMMTPNAPWGTFREVSLTSLAFSPKMARRSLSSAVSSVSPLGVTLPTRISPARTSAPIRIIPFSSRSFNASLDSPARSLVISSGPSLVSLASHSYSSIWIDVYTSSFTSLSLKRTASS